MISLNDYNVYNFQSAYIVLTEKQDYNTKHDTVFQTTDIGPKICTYDGENVDICFVK